MNLTHRFCVPAKLDAAWAAFTRLDQIAPCFPGATITDVDGNDYAGFVKIKFGPIPLVYKGTAQVTESNREARRMVVSARGHDRRGQGTATAKVTAAFTESGNITDIQVLTDLSITGRPAQFGSGVISDVSDRLLDLFVDCVSARFTDGEFATDLRQIDGEPTIEIPAVGSEDAAPPSAGTASGTATRTASGTASGTAPYVYTPPSSLQQPHLQVIGTLVPVVLKRYWPVLLGAAIGLAIGGRILRRRRNR